MLQSAEARLAQILGSRAKFRDGQREAIQALVEGHQRVLVVQRTGWGKSSVYFIATYLLRAQGAGVTLLISPLLALMRNQVQSAQAWGLRAAMLNSANYDEHAEVEAELRVGKIDLLLISPERLANDKFRREVWSRLRYQIGMLVIDEAHCISDWGHDFRPDYRRIMRLLDDLPKGTPVLGTTATANNRVVADVSEIIGTNLNIQRGALTRDSLQLYVYRERLDNATRLTLLTHLMKSLKGSGIIYCTTTKDCRTVADWLSSEGFDVKAYYADLEGAGSDTRAALEQALLDNKVKALVASVALGMGFDKPDLEFVIHYQLPGSLIGYYQQIGRAGRAIDNAHIILMHGGGDEDIQEYFIKSAFPTREQIEQVIAILGEVGAMSSNDLQKYVNVRSSVLEKILTHLEVEDIIGKEDTRYRLLRAGMTPDYERWEAVTANRYAELAQMQAYIEHDGCLMRFIADALDDPTPVQPCGRCKNCRQNTSKFQPNPQDVRRAHEFLRDGNPLTLEPRKQYPGGLAGEKKAKIQHLNEPGYALCDLYDTVWGSKVREARTTGQPFDDDLVEASAELLRRQWASLDNPPRWVTPVPSLRRPMLVPDFARRLARVLSLSYVAAVAHVEQHPEQRQMHNSYTQAANVQGRFVIDRQLLPGPVLLVDDVAQSKWTLTMIGELLRQHGCPAVYPFVLATMNG